MVITSQETFGVRCECFGQLSQPFSADYRCYTNNNSVSVQCMFCIMGVCYQRPSEWAEILRTNTKSFLTGNHYIRYHTPRNLTSVHSRTFNFFLNSLSGSYLHRPPGANTGSFIGQTQIIILYKPVKHCLFLCTEFLSAFRV